MNRWKMAEGRRARNGSRAVLSAGRYITKGLCAFAFALILLLGLTNARADMSEYSMAVPNLFQTDFDATITEWEGEGKSLSTSGCGMMCVSMALSYYQKEDAPSPMSVMRWTVESGLFQGNGLTRNNVQRLAEDYGLDGAWHRLNPFSMRRFLRQGHLIIAYMGKGMFTTGGHYILLRGTTADGSILVSDPYDEEKSEQAFNPQLLIDQAEGSSPFFVIQPPYDFVPSYIVNDRGEEVEPEQYLAARPFSQEADIRFSSRTTPVPTATPAPALPEHDSGEEAHQVNWLAVGRIIASSMTEDVQETSTVFHQIGEDLHTLSWMGQKEAPRLNVPPAMLFAQK